MLNTNNTSINCLTFGSLLTLPGFPFDPSLKRPKYKSPETPFTPSIKIIQSLSQEKLLKKYPLFIPATNHPSSTRTEQSLLCMGERFTEEADRALEKLFIAKASDFGLNYFTQEKFEEKKVSLPRGGNTVYFTNQAFSWTAFIVTNRLLKKAIHQMDPENKNPLQNRLFSVAILGATLTLVDLPLEFIRLQIQTNKSLAHLSIPETAKKVLQDSKIKDLYRGCGVAFGIKSVQTLLGALFYQAICARINPLILDKFA